MTPAFELSVVLPCLDEERTVGICVRKALATMSTLGVLGEVVVVDNGSTDSSVEIATAAGARVVRESLRGYGNALLRGFTEARGQYIIMADCDDSYDLTDLERFLVQLRAGADLVMGNRLRGTIEPGAMKWLHRWVGNPVLTWFLNLLFKTGMGDTHCGMRGFRRSALAEMNLQMPGMELASEMVIKASLANLRMTEMPIKLSRDGRDRPPHLRSFRDGWRHLRFMLMCSPLALFLIPGLLLVTAGVAAIPTAMLTGHGVFTDIFGPNFMYTSAMLAMVGFQVIAFGAVAKIHVHQVDPVFRDRWVDEFRRVFTVDRGILLATLLLLVASILGGPGLFEWLRHRTLSSPGTWIAALVIGAMAIETLFVSFLIGIIELSQQRHTQG
jgi:hypothetical protein